MGSKDAVESVRHWHPNFCSPQLLEGLCIQDEQESTLVLQEEEKGRVSVQAELLSTVLAHRGTSRPWRLNLWDRSTATQIPLGKHRHSKENSHLHCPCLAMAEQYPLGSKELSAREPQTQFWGLKSVLMLCDFDKLLTASLPQRGRPPQTG